MDILQKEIERKRKALELAKASDVVTNSSDLRREQEQAEQRLKAQSCLPPTTTKHTTTPTEVAGTNISGDTISKTTAKQLDQQSEVDLQTMQKMLRQWGLPIRLFAETENDIRERFCTARSYSAKQEMATAEADEFRLHAGHGMRNRFLEKDNEATTTSAEPPPQKKLKVLDESIQNDPHKLIYRYLKNILIQWEANLDSRPEDEKQTIAGKKDTRTYQQCKDYIKPLFQLCKNRSIEPHMLSKLQSIIRAMQRDEFVEAHDAYMDLAVGRAAWPIGVTMVGIHARSGRAKIESSNVAHVMNSELQRKYLTSVKRLMTYQQENIRGAYVAPSKKVG